MKLAFVLEMVIIEIVAKIFSSSKSPNYYNFFFSLQRNGPQIPLQYKITFLGVFVFFFFVTYSGTGLDLIQNCFNSLR